MNSEDRRVRLTKKILKEALIEMMHTKAIHEISIKKICEVANVNRSTFYHHYYSPQELYDDIINDIVADIREIVERHKKSDSGSTAIIEEMLTYVEKNRELFLVILSDKGNITVGEKFNKLIENTMGESNGSELSIYCIQFVSAGVSNILWRWLNKENRLPPKDIAGLITTIMMHGIRRAMIFSEKKAEI